MVICLERGADVHMAQLMPLPLSVSCFSKIQIGFIFLVPAHPGSPGKRAVKWVGPMPIRTQLLKEWMDPDPEKHIGSTPLPTDNHASTPPVSFYRPDALPAAQPTASKH